MDIKKLLGNKISQVRKEKGLSQIDFAEMLGVSTNALSVIETGNGFLTAETLEKILEKLNLEPDELFSFGGMKSNDELYQNIIKNLEIIIVDDNSIDNSVNIIKSRKDKRIKLIELKENNGAAQARNKGIEVSTGEYICFLDSDDYWYNKKIEKQLKFIKNKAFIYSEYLYLKNNKTHIAHVPKSLTYNQLLKNSAIFTSTVMLNMKYLNKEDVYMPNIKMGQDYGTWYKILKKIGIAYGMQEVLSIYRVGN